MTVCDSVDIRHIPRVQAESPDSRFLGKFSDKDRELVTKCRSLSVLIPKVVRQREFCRGDEVLIGRKDS